jgi:Serine aminopeptidase, S33
MTLARALKETERSLTLASIRAAVRVGAVVAPQRTARSIAQRFFATSRPPLERLAFRGDGPRVGVMAVPDGTLTTYRWGADGGAPTVLLTHGWNGWARQMEAFVAPLVERGFAVLAFDHVAHGLSDGAATTLPAMIRSTERVLAQTPGVVGAIAHSLGAGALAAALVSTRRALAGAVLIAPPSDPRPYLLGMAQRSSSTRSRWAASPSSASRCSRGARAASARRCSSRTTSAIATCRSRTVTRTPWEPAPGCSPPTGSATIASCATATWSTVPSSSSPAACGPRRSRWRPDAGSSRTAPAQPGAQLRQTTARLAPEPVPMWKNLLKLLHFASLAGLGGGVVVILVLLDTIDATSPAAVAGMHAAIALICSGLVVPSLVVLLLTGMLLVVARPHLISARWVWAKALVGVIVAATILAGLQPLVLALASMSATGALGDAPPGPLASTVETERWAAYLTLANVVAAVVIAVWRPRLGRTTAGRDSAD